MRCPECGVEVNEETSRCHSCGALLHITEEKPESKFGEIGKAAKRTFPFLFLVGYLLLLLFITYPLYVMFDNRQKSERLHDNLEIIIDNLKEYASEHGVFPVDLQLLIDDGYITNFPDNPYHDRYMKPRSPGYAFSGDFTYLPIYDERGRVLGCVLLGYGPNIDGGRDIFTEGKDYTHLPKFSPDPDGKPDGIIHILTAQRGEFQVRVNITLMQMCHG